MAVPKVEVLIKHMQELKQFKTKKLAGGNEVWYTDKCAFTPNDY